MTATAPSTVTTPGFVGQRLVSPHTRDLVQGLGRYVSDIEAPGRLEAHFVRSYLAHAVIGSVDVAGARSSPGVVGAWSAADLPDLPAVAPPPRSGQSAAMRRPALARGRVRFVGEPVAVVLATDRYLAEDAAELVGVDLEDLPVVLDPRAALAAAATELFPGTGNLSSARSLGGPAEEALARAPVSVQVELTNQRLAPMSIEPRAILVVPDGAGFHVWCSSQAPHRLRDALCRAFSLDQDLVRVTAPDVGGAFGAKSQVYAEYLVVFELARRTGRPVRWVEDRSESLVAATHGRGQHTVLQLGATTEGRLVALVADIVADVGAYPDHGDFLPEMTAWVMSGPYQIPALQVRTRSVVTNKAPTASYRGAGRPEAAYVIERAMDELAARLGLDPAELRRRNFIPEDAFPYHSPTGAVYDSGRYAAALELALRDGDYAGWRAEQARRRQSGELPLLGIGLASWVERSGGDTGSSEYARVELSADGQLLGRVGTNPQGQGHDIAMRQVLADAVGLPLEEVDLRQGDTAEVAHGTGAFASRSLQVGGTALDAAGKALLTAAAAGAAGRLGIPVGELAYQHGRFHAPDGRHLALRECGPLAAEHVASPPQAFPFGCYLAVVEVHPGTGQVHLVRLTAVDDVGTVVNPLLVEGQILGSLTQGIGQALYEHASYDDAGQPQAATLLDYTIPTALEIPPIGLSTLVTPNPNVALGVKGAGESGCIGAPPAILNAVRDALGWVDPGDLQMPLTAERVLAALNAAEPATAPAATPAG